MLAARLKGWLKEGTYDEGVALMKEVSQNSFLIEMLSEGDSYYNRIRLREELEKISELMPVPKAGADDDFFQMPAEVQAVVKDAKKYFRMMMQERDKLFSDEKEVRRVAALSILELSKLNKECWAKVEYWRKYKALPSEVSDEGLDDLALEELVRLRDLDRNYIWKHEKKLKKLSGEKKDRLADRIKDRRIRLASVELKLSKLSHEQ